jgi:hypothetical protein
MACLTVSSPRKPINETLAPQGYGCNVSGASPSGPAIREQAAAQTQLSRDQNGSFALTGKASDADKNNEYNYLGLVYSRDRLQIVIDFHQMLP